MPMPFALSLIETGQEPDEKFTTLLPIMQHLDRYFSEAVIRDVFGGKTSLAFEPKWRHGVKSKLGIHITDLWSFKQQIEPQYVLYKGSDSAETFAKKLGLDPRVHYLQVTEEIVRLAARAAKDL